MTKKPPNLLQVLHNRLGIDVGYGANRKVANSRLNKVMTKHRMSEDDVLLVIEYAVRHNKLVRNVEGLPYLLPEARAEKRKDDADKPSDLDGEIASAIDTERALYGDTSWVSRLIRARGKARAVVIQEWRQERGT